MSEIFSCRRKKFESEQILRVLTLVEFGILYLFEKRVDLVIGEGIFLVKRYWIVSLLLGFIREERFDWVLP